MCKRKRIMMPIFNVLSRLQENQCEELRIVPGTVKMLNTCCYYYSCCFIKSL